MGPKTSARFSLALAVGVVFLAVANDACASDWLKPREIDVDRVNVAPELVDATRDSQIERGKRRPVLDGVGWVFGIPSKVILWDRRVENHNVSADTEEAIRQYLDDNDLDHVKVRINQYAPLEDWRRLRANKTVGWGYRYTFGALSVAGEAILPGRLIGGDHYNPFTGTIHLYSDVSAIALHVCTLCRTTRCKPLARSNRHRGRDRLCPRKRRVGTGTRELPDLISSLWHVCRWCGR